jgi:hypothetical protein
MCPVRRARLVKYRELHEREMVSTTDEWSSDDQPVPPWVIRDMRAFGL